MAMYLSFSLLESVQEIQVRHITFIVRINLSHQFMKLLLAHTETEAFQHTSEVAFGDSAIFIL